MTGLIKRSMVVAAVMLSATFAYAGNTLKAVNGGGNDDPKPMHPAPQASDTGIWHANDNSALNPTRDVGSDKDKVRKLRPAKPVN